MPSGPGPIEESRIRDIARTVPPGVATFLLTCETAADAVVAQQRFCRTNTVQLVDSVTAATRSSIGQTLLGVAIVQVVHVQGERSIDEAIEAAVHSNALLLDSGNPAAKVKELGGTGRAHDWAISRRIRDSARVPVYLAGGLNPSNICEAIERIDPFGVDVCSGLRTNGLLDERKLAAFMDGVHRARP
jgi:phosphoribosylanthranilate isomerase